MQAKKPAQERVEPLASHPCVLTQRVRAFFKVFSGFPHTPLGQLRFFSKFDPTDPTALRQSRRSPVSPSAWPFSPIA